MNNLAQYKREALQKISGTNHHMAKSYYQYKLRRLEQKFDQPPILILQMGKVGSSSITHSLKQLNLQRSIFHVHTLSEDFITQYQKQFRSFLGTEQEHSLRHIWLCDYLRKRLDAGLSERWKVVTLVRDPVARNLSTFFQNMIITSSDERSKTFFSPEHRFTAMVQDGNLEQLYEYFFSKIDHTYPLRFWDREFKRFFDIDLLEADFPIEQGYKVYETKQADILLIRLEDLSSCASRAFQEFLGIDNFVLQDTNIGAQKRYSEEYRLFKNTIPLTESYLDNLYASTYMKRFYSKSEIAAFKARWLRNSTGR